MKNFLEKIIANENIHKTDLSVLLHLVKMVNNDLTQVVSVNQKDIAYELRQYQPAISKSLKNLMEAGFISYTKHEVKFLFDSDGNIKK
jgi:predicted transcriptional regulator